MKVSVVSMDPLTRLFNILTETCGVYNQSDAAEQLDQCKKLLTAGLKTYTRISPQEAASIRVEDIPRTSGTSKVSDDDWDNYTRNQVAIVRILHISVSSVRRLLDDTASDCGKDVADFCRRSSENVLNDVMEYYFRRRRLILVTSRYIYESSRNVRNMTAHPFQSLFEEIVDSTLGSSGFCDCLVSEYGSVLSRLKEHCENPEFSFAFSKWLSLQLEDTRDLLLLMFDLCGYIPKEISFVEMIIHPLVIHGSFLERLPVSQDKEIGSIQMELSQQFTIFLTAFLLRYFIIGTPIFTRDNKCFGYLDKIFPKLSNFLPISPAAVIYLMTRLEMDSSLHSLGKCLNDFLSEINPFFTLCLLLRSESLQGELKEILANLINDVGEQFLRLFGMENVGIFQDDFFSLAAGVFHHPKFWKLLCFLEKNADFFMYQVVAFITGFSSLTGDDWLETSRELNNEIIDLRHQLHEFLNGLEDDMDVSTSTVPAAKPRAVLPLIVQIMTNFRTFYESLRDDLYKTSSATTSFSAPRTERKKVKFTFD